MLFCNRKKKTIYKYLDLPFKIIRNEDQPFTKFSFISNQIPIPQYLNISHSALSPETYQLKLSSAVET